MDKRIAAGILVVAAAAGYGGFRFAKAVDAPRATQAQSRAPDYASIGGHVDRAIEALTPEYSDRTIPFFSFELSATKNARPGSAREELAQVIRELERTNGSPDERRMLQGIHDSLPDRFSSGSDFIKERRVLQAYRDAIRAP